MTHLTALCAGLFVAAAAKGGDPMNSGIGDYGQSTKQYAGPYQKYMSSGGQGSTKDQAGGDVLEYASKFLPSSAKGYVERPGSSSGIPASDYQQYMKNAGGGNYDQYMKQYAGDYSKYMKQGGSASSGGDYDKYMKQYAGDYSKYMKQGGS